MLRKLFNAVDENYDRTINVQEFSELAGIVLKQTFEQIPLQIVNQFLGAELLYDSHFTSRPYEWNSERKSLRGKIKKITQKRLTVASPILYTSLEVNFAQIDK